MMEKNQFPPDPRLLRMIKYLKDKGTTNQKILDVFKIVDRKFFLVND